MALAPLLMRLGQIAALRALDETTEELGDVTISVNSSCIASIGWHPSSETIEVTFHRGGTYSYAGTEELFAQFVAAGSKGQFFNAHFQVRR